MVSDLKFWFLQNHQLFSILSRSEIKALFSIVNFRTARRGEIILFAHNEMERVYTIKKGIIKILEFDQAGNEIIKDIVRAGDLFGQYTLEKHHEDREEHAIVVSDQLVICSFTVNDFEKILENNPKLAIKYTKLVGIKLKRVSNLYTNLMYKDVRTRLGLFLKDWVMKEADGQLTNIVIKNYLTHQEIASLICSTRQTVTLLLNELKQAGVLEHTRKELIIPDLEKLIEHLPIVV